MSEYTHDNRYILAEKVVKDWDLETLVEYARDMLVLSYTSNPNDFKLDWDWAFGEGEGDDD